MSFVKGPENKELQGGLTLAGISRLGYRIAVSSGDLGSGEHVTDLSLPDGVVVEDVMVEVMTAEATGGTQTLDVGLDSGQSGGDVDGFLDGVDVSTTGLRRGVLADGTLGAFLEDDVAGDGTDLARKMHNMEDVGADTISVTPGSNDFAELEAQVYVITRRVESMQ